MTYPGRRGRCMARGGVREACRERSCGPGAPAAASLGPSSGPNPSASSTGRAGYWTIPC